MRKLKLHVVHQTNGGRGAAGLGNLEQEKRDKEDETRKKGTKEEENAMRRKRKEIGESKRHHYLLAHGNEGSDKYE